MFPSSLLDPLKAPFWPWRPLRRPCVQRRCFACPCETSIMNKYFIRASTVVKNVKELNNFHEVGGIHHLVDINSKHNQAASLIRNLQREEDVSRQHIPWFPPIMAWFIKKGNHVNSQSKRGLIKNIFIVSFLIWQHTYEIIQCTTTKPDVQTYPKSKQVTKWPKPNVGVDSIW